MSDPVYTKHGCGYQLDLDGQIICIICGAINTDTSTALTLDVFENQVDFELFKH